MNQVHIFLTILAYFFSCFPLVFVVIHNLYCRRSMAYRIKYGDISFLEGKWPLIWLAALLSWTWLIAGWLQ